MSASICTHHNDQQRTACPVCLVAALTAERDQLRAEVEQRRKAMADTVRELGEGCCGLLHEEIAPKVKEMRAEVERLIAQRDNLLKPMRESAIARAERAEDVLSDPQQLHAHCLRTLNEGQIAHLFGGRMTEIVNRAKKAEAELATERARLRGLAAAQRELDKDIKEARAACQPYGPRQGRTLLWWRGQFDGLVAARAMLALADFPTQADNARQIDAAMKEDAK